MTVSCVNINCVILSCASLLDVDVRVDCCFHRKADSAFQYILERTHHQIERTVRVFGLFFLLIALPHFNVGEA
jgi:hypothetical protein